MSFDQYGYLCNHHPNQGIEYFSHPKTSLMPFLVNPSSWYQANIDLISINIVYFFLF